MKFPLALALVALTSMVAAEKWDFEVYYPSPADKDCGGPAQRITGEGNKSCLKDFSRGAASAWKLHQLGGRCTMYFYTDQDCKDKIDWIDTESPRDQCKVMPNYEAARSYKVPCV
ncbi:hypothetical protein GGR52DRAFT_574110 [Hypoxylon sp. FL1284]|nr:hypothetical protein GGR52DRAFT_574110 [Hypoxylon sp. FL1284]